MHDPDFDQVLRPVEFDEAILDKFVVALTVSDDTFHVTVVGFAGGTEPPVRPPNDPATASTDTAIIRLMQQTLYAKYGSLFVLGSVRQVFVKMFRKVR